MIRVQFFAKDFKNPSFSFYSQLMGELTPREHGVDFSIAKDFVREGTEKIDVALVMGGEYSREWASALRQSDPSVRIGVIDPRPAHCPRIDDLDFIVANGLESRDFYYKFVSDVFVYYTYPLIETGEKKSSDRIVLGYHGNRIHIEAMAPRITTAINNVAKEYPLALKLFYNVKNLGQSGIGQALNCPVEHIQFDPNGYGAAFADCDIGIIPQLIPLQRRGIAARVAATLRGSYNEEDDDYLMRFKTTTNNGRAFVFAQMGIPMVMDLSPSATQLMEYGEDGYYAYYTESWEACLRRLASDASHRQKIGQNMKARFQLRYSPSAQNKLFADYIHHLMHSPCAKV